MQDARVGIFDDAESIRMLVSLYMNMAGHIPVLEAGSMDEAREAIAMLEPGSLDVAVVDGNIDTYNSGADGAELTRLLRGKMESLFIIGYSATDLIEGVDINIRKGGSPDPLVEAIARL